VFILVASVQTMTDDKPIGAVLDAEALCTYLGITRPTLDKLIDAGKAPPSRDVGTGKQAHRRWSRAAVDAWLAAGNTTTPTDGGPAR
jgi:excisionase family DNA binding protein